MGWGGSKGAQHLTIHWDAEANVSLFDWLIPKRAILRSYEAAILESVVAACDAPVSDLLAQHIACFTSVTRLSRDKEVLLYCKRKGKVDFPSELLFADKRDEAKLATATILNPDNKQKLKVDVWLSGGQLFSLTFNQSPNDFFQASGSSELLHRNIEVKIWFDPTHCSSNKVVSIEQSIGNIEARIPDDYLTLYEATDKNTHDAWSILSPNSVRTVVLDEANYYILAEGPHAALMVKQESQDQVIYFVDLETDEIQAVGTSLRAALRALTGHNEDSWPPAIKRI